MSNITDSVIDYTRQSGLISNSQMEIPVVLIGAGGIGSPLALILSKMGIPRITVFDDDKVEAHNLPNQMYRKKDLGKLKVDALKEICEDYSDVEFTAIPTRFDHNIREKSIVVSGVDSMKSRHEIWQKIKLNPAVIMYIDARMGKEMVKIYRVNPTDIKSVKEYEATLHSDEEAIPVPCTERAIIYTSLYPACRIPHVIRSLFTDLPQVYNELFFDYTSGAQLYDAKM